MIVSHEIDGKFRLCHLDIKVIEKYLANTISDVKTTYTTFSITVEQTVSLYEAQQDKKDRRDWHKSLILDALNNPVAAIVWPSDNCGVEQIENTATGD